MQTLVWGWGGQEEGERQRKGAQRAQSPLSGGWSGQESGLASGRCCQPPPKIPPYFWVPQGEPNFPSHNLKAARAWEGRCSELGAAPTSRRLARIFSTSLKSLRSCLFLPLVPSISSSAWKRKYCDSSLNSLFSSTANPQKRGQAHTDGEPAAASDDRQAWARTSPWTSLGWPAWCSSK